MEEEGLSPERPRKTERREILKNYKKQFISSTINRISNIRTKKMFTELSDLTIYNLDNNSCHRVGRPDTRLQCDKGEMQEMSIDFYLQSFAEERD